MFKELKEIVSKELKKNMRPMCHKIERITKEIQILELKNASELKSSLDKQQI